MTGITADDLVRREVHYCVSSLVSTLAQNDLSELNSTRELAELNMQAIMLASPVDDWEEAALEGGIDPYRDEFGAYCWRDKDGGSVAGTAQEACEFFGIDEPYQREVFEHWIVSDWLADKLAEKGEKVDKDFAGMTVWARTTTGQGIAADSVIEAIVADLNKGA